MLRGPGGDDRGVDPGNQRREQFIQRFGCRLRDRVERGAMSTRRRALGHQDVGTAS
jgi:hypothetical protein